MPADVPGAATPPGHADLSQVRGRAPRVALLVYNHAANDARVLKTADSLRSAGAQVRIFAVARARAGYAEGPGVVGADIEVQRAAEVDLTRQAPWLLRIARRLTGRPDPAATTTPSPPLPAPVGPPADPSPIAVTGRDLWLRTYRTLSLALYWAQTARSVAAWAPDVVHANDGNTLAPALWIQRATGAQIVYDSHELWRHRHVRTDRPIAPLVEAVIETWGMRRAAGVITVSPSIGQWLHQRYQLPRAPTLVRNAPRAQPLTSPEGPGPPGRLRELSGLGDADRVIAYGGRITTSRGIEETLQALVLLPARVHFVLLGYGEPDYVARLHTLIARWGLGSRVHFVGAVAPGEVSGALADADVSVVFVRPICVSYEFSLPNKLFESIHAGVPVVVADVPDTAALVREYGVGEVFVTDDPTDMARTIAAVLADPRAYRSAARAAAAAVTWQHEEGALLTLYADVLAR